MSRAPFPDFHGNINFNAQHSPMGAFMSFTCGMFGAGGGIGVEIGKPASQNLYIGVKSGDRRSTQPIRCLPFVRRAPVPVPTGAANYVTAQPPSVATPSNSIEICDPDSVRRSYAWATDTWAADGFSFSIFTPFGPIPEPGLEPERLRASLLPAIVATFTVDNRAGSETKTGVFAIDFGDPGTRLLFAGDASEGASGAKLGFAWRRELGVLGMLQNEPARHNEQLFAFQRWAVAEGVCDINPVHELGTCGGLAFEVPPGKTQTLVLAIGVHLEGLVTTGLEGKYYYTRLYASLDEVLAAALERAPELRSRAARLDAKLRDSHLSPDQQFIVAHATRSYYGSTQMLDVGGEPFWVVNEGEYCMMNTLDLSIDHAFWELEHNPWIVRNVLNNFVRHYSYRDQVKDRSPGQAEHLLPGGISFCHDMGANNNFSRPGNSSYELANLNGCFSYMTQEQLCNWILTAACYVLKTDDTSWLIENAHVLSACAESMRARASSRSGVMSRDSSRCASGKEITTYDSLDESLGQARGNTYLAVKCFATWLALDVLAQLAHAATGDESIEIGESLAPQLADHLLASVRPDGTLPAVLERDNPGYNSRILPAIEALVYPGYWLACLATRGDHDSVQQKLRRSLRGPFFDLLRQHTVTLLRDPQARNLFPDGGIRLSSSSSNSWMSKIALFQFVARDLLRLHELDPDIAAVFARADAAHVRWQTDGSSFWACSDQFINGVAKGSRYYPRIITAALWMNEASRSILAPPKSILPATPLEAPTPS